MKRDAARRQHVGREPAHSLGQIRKMVFRRVDRPDDIRHRFDELVRNVRNAGQRFGRAVAFALRLRDFREHGDLRQTRADVVVQIGRDARAVPDEPNASSQ